MRSSLSIIKKVKKGKSKKLKRYKNKMIIARRNYFILYLNLLASKKDHSLLCFSKFGFINQLKSINTNTTLASTLMFCYNKTKAKC